MICLCSDLPFPFNSACTGKDSQFPTGCILYAPRSVDFGQVPSRKVLERWQDVSPLALWWRWHLPHGSQSCRTNPDADISGFWALSLDCQVQNGSGSPLAHIPRSHHWLLFYLLSISIPYKTKSRLNCLFLKYLEGFVFSNLSTIQNHSVFKVEPTEM